MDEFEYVKGIRFFSFISRRERSHLERIIFEGIEVVSGAALTAWTWQMNAHPMWTVTFSAMTLERVILFLKDARKYLQEFPSMPSERVFLPIGTFTYITGVYAYSELREQGNLLWIPSLAISVYGYIIATESLTMLGRTSIRTGACKIINKTNQLLFGPALINGAYYYLVIVRQHDEKWMNCLPIIASIGAADYMSLGGYNRCVRIDGPRWLLYMGLELMVGGCLKLISSSLLLIYSVNNELHPVILVTFSLAWIAEALADIDLSEESFQVYLRIQENIFYTICYMIEGPIIFLLGCGSLGHSTFVSIIPISFIIAGCGLAVFGFSIWRLRAEVPHRKYIKYCQRVLGPSLTAYSSLASVYVGYRMEWRYSLVMVPFICTGIYYTYRGFSRSNRRR